MLIIQRERWKNLPIAPEGLPFLIISLLLIFTFPRSFFPYALLFSFAFFFRNPKRTPPLGKKLVVSPADGKVIDVVEGDTVKVSIFMSLLDVHVNRIPLEGVVEEIKYKKGKFYPAFRKDLTKENERNTVVVRHGNISYKVTQVAGIVARRIACYLKKGQKVGKGEVMGIICFGSLVEVEFPGNVFTPLVKEGKRVKAGETAIGELKDVDE